MKRTLSIIVMFLLTASTFLSAVPTEALRYTIDSNLHDADASYDGEVQNHRSGDVLSEAGDVNGDGYDDFLIGAAGWFDINFEGKAYLIFGKASGLTMNTSLANADASFIGEEIDDRAGCAVAGAGDVNGDGYDDILIGAQWNNEGGSRAGQAYLFFGKASGWSNNIDLSNADASFIGEVSNDQAGRGVAGVGDINGDGYDDFLIGAPHNDENGGTVGDAYDGAGQTYLILGKATGWSKDTSLANADASFFGIYQGEESGMELGGGGDINNDGLDDMLIGAMRGYGGWGRTYIVFGSTIGWSMDMELRVVPSFIGEEVNSGFASQVDIPGDVNGDGIDDILVGSQWSDTGANSGGEVFIFFGKETGWGKNVSASTAEASYAGEGENDYAGSAASGAGDVNGDGFADIIVGAHMNREVETGGQSYLILGKASGWGTDISLSNSDASFIPMNPQGDNSGWAVSSAGDFNMDGFDDILIGEPQGGPGLNNAGRTYLIFPDLNQGPTAVTTIKAYSDAAYTNEISLANFGDTVYIELRGTDGNSSRKDIALVNVTSSSSSPVGFRLRLVETGSSTGIYRGFIMIKDDTREDRHWIKAWDAEIVNVSYTEDPTKSVEITVVGDLTMLPVEDKTTVLEDDPYDVHYSLMPAMDAVWTIVTNGTWMHWNESSRTLEGTPDNQDVGWYDVKVNATSPLGYSNEHEFVLTVINVPPEITTYNVVTAYEDSEYIVDYNSTDDGQGTITWHLETNANWLEINESTGVLNGTPLNEHVGVYWVHVGVDDGNGGWAWANYTLAAAPTNDPPMIIGEDNVTAYLYYHYSTDYDVFDEDVEDTIFEWALETNASFLGLDPISGVLSGDPFTGDLGSYWVNVSVSDPAGASDHRNFTLEVINLNHRPLFTDVPSDSEILDGSPFRFDVNAVDTDVEDVLIYTISSVPTSDIVIDPLTGVINWRASREPFGAEPRPYVLNVTVMVSDDHEEVQHTFDITVMKPNQTAVLGTPADGSKVGSTEVLLNWSATDPWDDPMMYDVYFSEDRAKVEALEESVRMVEDFKETSVEATSLEMGKTYHWTVIPHDGTNYGICMSGVFSFTPLINNPPSIKPIRDQKVTAGRMFELKAEGSDADVWDGPNLTYSLEPGAPDGMSIDPKSGKISWKPKDTQVGDHLVIVRLSDGKEYGNASFVIKVTEATDVSVTGSWLPILILVIIVVVVVILVLSRYMRDRKEKDDVQGGSR